ncbi:LysR family transcriptional regulator [Bradyrhizobium sp. LHD-71]|uniref:LysR family transcriptional regulator n=1 Tax=Bradyrhizobium sp. LHD-71 TaxID=3072141 RepID=UPI00280FD627|nr:LysR family transcriptional regulator [Bradyrhizobium sp. LHD-71]MDQ8726411.1 LysR family transcriptional regulator [Bradyrhizobium sp. LHD-71]
MQEFFALDDLRLIQAISEVGTLTGAARRLNVDHSTAFRRLSSLEKRLGAHLFERARNGYTPTSAGEAAVATAARILDDLNALEFRLAGEDRRPSGVVRVTTADTLLELIGPIFAELRAEHPAITIELAADNSFLTLTKRDADIAVRPAIVAPETLVARRVAAVATAPYASQAYLARWSGQTNLAAHEWVGFDDSLGHLGSARWLDAHVARDRIVCRVNSLMALRAAARAGMGVAALPCYLGDADPALRRIHPPLMAMEASLWLLTHPDLRRVARVRTVLDFVAGHLTKQRALIEGKRAAAGAEASAPTTKRRKSRRG